MTASPRHWRGLIAVVLALVAGAHIAPGLIAEPAGIEENRTLAGPPAWPRSLAEAGGFRKAADAYVADRFPLRAHLIGPLNRLRMLAGVSGSERVIVGRGGDAEGSGRGRLWFRHPVAGPGAHPRGF